MTIFPSILTAALLAHLLGQTPQAPQQPLYPIDASLRGSIGGARVHTSKPFQLSVTNRESLIDFEVWADADADAETSVMVHVSLDPRALEADQTGRATVTGRSGTDPWNWSFEEQAQFATGRVERLGPDRTLLVIDAEFAGGHHLRSEIELAATPD